MLWQLICTAQHFRTSAKNQKDLCNLCWVKLFQQSNRMSLLGQSQLLRLLKAPNWPRPRDQGSPSSGGPPLTTAGDKTPAGKILPQELTRQPAAVPTSETKSAQNKRLQNHRSQFRGKANAFKKRVADVNSVLQSSDTTKQDLAETTTKAS